MPSNGNINRSDSFGKRGMIVANWKESIRRMAQSGVAKSKEVAEVTRLNMELSGHQQKLREQHSRLGEYLLAHPELLPGEDETVSQIQQAAAECRENIARCNQQIMDIRSLNLCPRCGAEVSRASRFCDKCGMELERPALNSPAVPAEASAQEEAVPPAEAEEAPEPSAPAFCPQCGAQAEAGTLFCGECGARLEEAQPS